MLLMTNLTICLSVSVYSWELLLGAAEASVRNTGVDWIVCASLTRNGVHDHLSVGSDHVLQGDPHTQWSQVWETIGESFHWIALNQSQISYQNYQPIIYLDLSSKHSHQRIVIEPQSSRIVLLLLRHSWSLTAWTQMNLLDNSQVGAWSRQCQWSRSQEACS